MKKKTVKWIKLILKYLLPAILGWVEGDSHAIADSLSAVFSLII